MNTTRIVIAGLVAGLVLNVGDFVINGFLMTAEMDLLRQRLNLNPDVLQGTSVLVTWLVVDSALGLLIAWLYAAMRPRLGPGPGTALAAGFVPFVSVTLVMFGLTAMGIFILASTVKNSVFWAINMAVASLVAGKVYQE